ncbi:MAG: MotA/TolQ/ExbB proton channel family protein [Phycisphaeraceae bacterium]
MTAGNLAAESPSTDAAAQGEPAAAQPAETAGEAGAVVMGEGVPTIAELYMTSPYINSTLLVMSVIAVLLFLYMLATVTTTSFSPPRFVDDVTRLVLNKQFEQAIHLCQSQAGVFIASPVQRVVENRDKPHGVIIDILHAEGRRRGEMVWNRIGFLSEISNIAPMIGLLGTLVGMIKVFFTLTTRTTGETAAGLSEGIAEAMSTTMFGILVAIAAGVFYTLIRSRAVRVLAETEQICHTLADHTVRVGADPRIKRIDALADAARRKVTRSSAEPHAPSGAVPGEG